MKVSPDLIEALRLDAEFSREQLASSEQQSFQRMDNEMMETPDYRTAEDFEQAAEILATVLLLDGEGTVFKYGLDESVGLGFIGVVGKTWRQRAAYHVAEKLDRSFRDRVPLRTEQLALAEIKRIALILKDSADAHLHSAERLKKKGDLSGAGTAFQAYRRFSAEAHALLGDER